MMKKILTIALVLVLAACNTTGRRADPWSTQTYPTQAESAPKKLTREAGTPGGKEEHSVYTPYVSSSETAQVYGYDEDTQPGVQQSAAARTYAAQKAAEKAGQESSAYASAANRYAGEQQGQAPERFTADRSLPPVKVALLLPLSGNQSDIGQAMLQAAQLALFDMGYESFQLMPRDTKGNPQTAAQEAQAAINEGAQLILGPLFAEEVKAVKPVAGRYNIKIIGFSTDWSLAGNGTYIMGFLPFAQVQRVAEYSVSKGMSDIGILAPNNDYGNAVVAAFNSFSYRAGLGTADVARFMPGSSDTDSIVRSFTEYDSRPHDNPAAASPLPFQAVLLPVGGEQARSIASLLSQYDLGPSEVKRLGTGLWDDRSLAGEAALEGAWFAAPSPDLRRDFERKYRNMYGNRPQRLATLAYDATALAAVLARKSFYERGRPSFETADIINANGYAGIDGIFRFRPDGLVERGLAVLEFRNGEIRVIDPAPSTFQRMDY